MRRYKSKSGKKSGVTAYETGPDFIIVQFAEATYKYTYASAGKPAVEQMKRLAKVQNGLSTYISQNRDNLGFEIV